MKGLQRYLMAAVLAVVCAEGFAQPGAAGEQLVTQPVLPKVQIQGFAPTIQPGAGQPRVNNDFGSALNQRETRADKGLFRWGIIGHGVGFNKRF